MKPNTVMMGFFDNTLPEDLLRNRQFPRRRKILNYGINHSLTGALSLNSNSLSMVQFDGNKKIQLRANNKIIKF